MIKVLKEVISAIENGQKTEDSRGVVYRQEFGESFLNKIKEVLKKEEQYLCSKESNDISFEEFSKQAQQIAKDFKHPFECYEMKSCKSENESSN